MTTAQLAVAPASAAAVDPDNPWPGLESYDEASTEFFNGRQAEADDLLRRIVDEPVTILFGKSGLGKTSLLHAGVFPRLRGKDLLPITVRLQIGTGSEPLIQQVRARLLEALATEGIEHQKPRSDETLWEYLHRADQEFWTPQNRLVRPVLFFDQFEELFTLGAAVPEAVLTFREDLADLAENRISADLAKRIDQDEGAALHLDGQAMPYKIVIALREDFLADLEGWRQTMPTLRRNRMRLLPMGSEQALQAVHNERTKHLVSEPIARRIVSFLSAGAAASDSADQSGPAVEPALLSLFCRGINEHRKRDHKSTFDDALIEGGKGTIVVDFYRSCLADQRPRVRCFIEEDLVTDYGYRNSYAVEDALGHGAVTASELETLINRHLLRHEQHLGIERVELTHDILTKAVVEERDTRRLAEGAERERRNRWKKLRAVAVGLFLLIVPAFGWLAWRASTGEQLARTAERLAQSRQLAAVSGQLIDRDPELALSIAAEGLSDDGTAEARGALLDAARYVWPSATLGSEELGARARIVALNADGSRLAVLAGTALTLWDVTVRPLRPVWSQSLELQDSTSLAFGPDQKVIVVGRAKAITVVDVASGRPSFELTSPLSEVNDRMASFSPDFRWLVWKASDSALAMVDFTDPNQVPQNIDASDVLAFAVVSHDKIVTITGSSLDKELLSKTPAGWKREKLEVRICRENAHSVSPGTRYLAATWPGVKCTYAADGTGSPTLQEIERQMEDIIWSAGGRAFTELQQSGELVVGRDDQPAAIIKGERSISDQQDRTRLISVSDAGNRLAIIDEHGDHHLVKVFSLSVNKPFLSGVASNGFVAAPSGDWFAVINRDPDTHSASADIVAIDSDFAAGHLSEPRRIALGVARLVAASPDSLIVTGEDSTTVFDIATGQPRYPRLTGEAAPIGATGELLMLSPTQIVKTRDGSAVIPAGETKERMEGPLLISNNKDAIAWLRALNGGAAATLYRVRGDTLTKVGEIQGLPALTSGDYSSVQIADDGRSLTLGSGDESRRFFVAGNDGQAASPKTVDPQLEAVSRTGTYELRREPRADAAQSNHDTDTIHLVRASADAEKAVVRRIAAIRRDHYQFSSDDSLLAAWSERGLQIVQTGSGEVLVSMKINGIEGVEFLGRNAMVRVTSRDEVMLMPIDQALMKRFAAWLNPRPVTAEERCLYGLPGAECR